MFHAVCRKYGVLRGPMLDDLIEGRLPSARPAAEGRRIAIAGSSGGAKGLLLDYASEQGPRLATLAPATAAALSRTSIPACRLRTRSMSAPRPVQPQKFSEICRLICADPNVDLFIMQGQLPITAGEPYPIAPFQEVLAATDKPVICYGRTAQNVTDAGRAFQAKAGLPFIQGLPETLRAAACLVAYAEAVRRGIAPLPPSRGEASSLAGAAFERSLEAHGLRLPRSARAKTPDEAAARAADIGFPVALKILSPAALHKTEVGGVALHLADRAAVRAAAAAMAARVPGPHDGFLLQEMVDGLELIAGVREDAQYGPVLAAGLGGVLVEALDDVALRLLPVDEAMAEEMLRGLKGAKLLGAFRGRRARDVAAAARAIAGLSRFFLDRRPFIADLEINPLMVLEQGQGVRAVNVRLVRRNG